MTVLTPLQQAVKVPQIEERDEAAGRVQDGDDNDDERMESLILMLILAEHMILHETGLDIGLIQTYKLGLVYGTGGLYETLWVASISRCTLKEQHCTHCHWRL